MALMKQDVHWQESHLVTRDDFPYILQIPIEQTREWWTSTYLKDSEDSKLTKNLCPVGCAILLYGQTDLCQQMLAEAAHYLASKLLDVDDFSMKMQKNYGDDDDKKPAGNQGESSAAEKSEGKAESAGPEDKSIPQSQKDGSSPPAKEVPPDDKFEKRTRPKVIFPKDIGVTFQDIGGMDEIKESLQELVIFPLRWPDLFKHGLPEPCKGILLFGPPGTGKTMLAKAIATEAGVSVINCSMSTVNSAWSGEAEKNVRALFTLAAKVAPTIIFVDDVDSMLAKREYGEPDNMRSLKNEFMSNWDGLMTKPGEQILVLATTNRPFDLDEAAIRRFERRVMVGLPTPEDREKILTTLLSKMEKVKTEGIDFKELARVTKDYTGSDLKILCKAAVNRRLREFIKRLNDWEREDNTEKEDIRALTMEDMKEAKKKVPNSYAAEGPSMNALKEWNELYGEGGCRKKKQLTYYM